MVRTLLLVPDACPAVKLIPSESTCWMVLPVMVMVVLPLPKPPAEIPLQPPPQCALLIMLPVTLPTKVPTLAELDLPMVMPLEPLPAAVQSVDTLFVIVLVL